MHYRDNGIMTKKKEPNKVGRPSKYSVKILEQTEKYLKEYKALGHSIPTDSSLCLRLGISRNTLYKWDKEYPQFSDLLEKLEALQREELLNNGLNGSFNSAISKLILHKHGYHERVEQTTDITSKGEQITGITREIIKS